MVTHISSAYSFFMSVLLAISFSWVVIFSWVGAIIWLPQNLHVVEESQDWSTNMKYFFISKIFISIEDLRQRYGIFSVLFSERFLSWKNHLQQSSANFDIWKQILVASVISTHSLISYFKEIVIAAFVMHHYFPNLSLGENSVRKFSAVS